MNNLEPKEEIINMLQEALNHPENYGTWVYPLGNYDNCRWAVVVSWMDYDNNGNENLYAKIAYQSLNNIMQCDYDIDWEMPYDMRLGEVYDTELHVGNEGDDVDPANIDWFLSEWEYIKANFIDEEG